MKSYTNKPKEEKFKPVAFSLDGDGKDSNSGFQLLDNRPQSVIQRQQLITSAKRQTYTEPVQKKENNTVVAGNLKTGIVSSAGVIQKYPYKNEENNIDIRDRTAFEKFLDRNRNDEEQLRLLMELLNADLVDFKMDMDDEQRSAERLEAVALRREVAGLLARIEERKDVGVFGTREINHIQSRLRTGTGLWDCHCFVTSKQVKVKNNRKYLTLRCSMSLSFTAVNMENSDPLCKKIGLVQIVKKTTGRRLQPGRHDHNRWRSEGISVRPERGGREQSIIRQTEDTGRT